MRNFLIAGLLAFLAAPVPGAEEDVRRLLEESRRVSVKIIDQIRNELVRELERTGPLRAIIVCKYSVPEITSAMSRQHGMRITRVSLRPRNPSIAEPDPWEQQILLDFERRVSKGEKVENLEHGEVVQEPAGRYYRYMRAIPVSAPCLACHGNSLSDGVKAQLNADYPHDRGADYQLGQVRGAVSVKKGL